MGKIVGKTFEPEKDKPVEKSEPKSKEKAEEK